LRKDRSEPATLLIVDGRLYLIDCGIGTIRRLVEVGIPSETLGTIFFTHSQTSELVEAAFHYISIPFEVGGP